MSGGPLGLPFYGRCIYVNVFNGKHWACLKENTWKGKKMLKKCHLFIFHLFGQFSPPIDFSGSSDDFLFWLWVVTDVQNVFYKLIICKNLK